MKITVPYAEEQFSRFNEMCFGGSLPEVPIVLTNARSYIGKMCYRIVRGLWGRKNSDYKMRLSTLFDLSEETWQDVIIHEMIHLHIAYNHLKDSSSHGKLFRAVMADINRRFGRHIVVSYKPNSCPNAVFLTDGRIRTHYICISTFTNGTKGITVCSPAMATKIDRDLSRCYKLSSREWFVSNDVYFNRFPHSRLPRIYKINAPGLEQHLNNVEKV